MNNGVRVVLEQAAEVAAELPATTARYLAELIAATEPADWPAVAGRIVGSVFPVQRREAVGRLLSDWSDKAPDLHPQAVSAAFLLASLAEERRRRNQCLELVWTGPDSDVIPIRLTEQVLLELISCARNSLTVVSYAVYNIPRIRQALVEAAGRGVRVRVILDMADPHDTDVYNPLLALGADVAGCTEILYWPKQNRPPDAAGRHGILHVKCVVADSHRLFLSSANLTEQALKINMELGVLITGTSLPGQVQAHFDELARRSVLLPFSERA